MELVLNAQRLLELQVERVLIAEHRSAEDCPKLWARCSTCALAGERVFIGRVGRYDLPIPLERYVLLVATPAGNVQVLSTAPTLDKLERFA